MSFVNSAVYNTTRVAGYLARAASAERTIKRSYSMNEVHTFQTVRTSYKYFVAFKTRKNNV